MSDAIDDAVRAIMSAAAKGLGELNIHVEEIIRTALRAELQREQEGKLKMRDDQIKHMVDRFLGWKLPENFNPDGGISFKKIVNENTPYPRKSEPVGTNLLDAGQAEEMVRYMVEGIELQRERDAVLEAVELRFAGSLSDAERQELYTLMSQWGRKPEILYQKVRDFLSSIQATSHAGALLAAQEAVERAEKRFQHDSNCKQADCGCWTVWVQNEIAALTTEAGQRAIEWKISEAVSLALTKQAKEFSALTKLKVAEARLDEAREWYLHISMSDADCKWRWERLEASRAAVERLKGAS